MRAGAEMLAFAEGDLLVRAAAKIETVWIKKEGLIPIPPRHPQRQPVALANLLAAELGIGSCDSRNMSYRTGPPEDLFDRARHQLGVIRQTLALGRMPNQGEEAAGD